MAIKTVFSVESTAEGVVADLAAHLAGFSVKFMVFFTSSKFDPQTLASIMNQRFAGAEVIGCTTAGEIISGKMLKNSLVAMAFDAEAMADVCVGVVKNLADQDQVSEVFAGFERHTAQGMLQLNPAKYVGIVLIDGLSLAEEKLMERIGDLTNVTFIGGSAGDDLKFKKTYVFAGGKAYTDAAVLALLKPQIGFDLVKTESFSARKEVLKATRVNEAKRIVYEFNGEPAIEAYAKALGVSKKDASNKFMSNPLGLLAGDEPYVRSPQKVQGDAMVFYCNVKEGMELRLLESTDIVQDTRDAVEARRKALGGISGLINFHCILRTLELEQEGRMGEYGEIFNEIPTIGFSTYGEEYLGHINQTSTILIFNEPQRA